MKTNKYIDIIPFGAISLIYALQDCGYSAYLVGGCVRDVILGVKPHDWDICTSAKPEDIIKIIKKTGYGYHTVGIEFGTVTAIIGESEYEITTYRADGEYTDGRHPNGVNYVSDIHKDLARRDFTINAMAYNPITNELVDDYGGQIDLERKCIRAVGSANGRFQEDALRILRAMRFAIRYNFDIAYDTLYAMKEHVKLLDKVSKERITAELEKILTCGKPITRHFIMCDWLIAQIIPEIKPCIKFWQNNKYHKHDVYEHMLNVVDNCKTNEFDIKLAALLHDIGKPKAYVIGEDGYGHFYGHPKDSYNISVKLLADRFRLTKETYKSTLALILYHDMEIACTKASVKRAINKFSEFTDDGIETLQKWFILKQADLDDHIFPDKKWLDKINIPKLKCIMQEIIDTSSCMTVKQLEINGSDIMKLLDIKPGKQVGIILQTLLEEVIDEKIVNEHEVLIDRTLEISKEIL